MGPESIKQGGFETQKVLMARKWNGRLWHRRGWMKVKSSGCYKLVFTRLQYFHTTFMILFHLSMLVLLFPESVALPLFISFLKCICFKERLHIAI